MVGAAPYLEYQEYNQNFAIDVAKIFAEGVAAYMKLIHSLFGRFL